MSEERLSKLQRVIIKLLQEKKHPITKKPLGQWPYYNLVIEAGEELERFNPLNPFQMVLGGSRAPDGFRSTFSQSAKNLEKKDLVLLRCLSGYGVKTTHIQLTVKGKALNLNKYVKNKKAKT